MISEELRTLQRRHDLLQSHQVLVLQQVDIATQLPSPPYSPSQPRQTEPLSALVPPPRKQSLGRDGSYTRVNRAKVTDTNVSDAVVQMELEPLYHTERLSSVGSDSVARQMARACRSSADTVGSQSRVESRARVGPCWPSARGT